MESLPDSPAGDKRPDKQDLKFEDILQEWRSGRIFDSDRVDISEGAKEKFTKRLQVELEGFAVGYLQNNSEVTNYADYCLNDVNGWAWRILLMQVGLRSNPYQDYRDMVRARFGDGFELIRSELEKLRSKIEDVKKSVVLGDVQYADGIRLILQAGMAMLKNLGFPVDPYTEAYAKGEDYPEKGTA